MRTLHHGDFIILVLFIYKTLGFVWEPVYQLILCIIHNIIQFRIPVKLQNYLPSCTSVNRCYSAHVCKFSMMLSMICFAYLIRDTDVTVLPPIMYKKYSTIIMYKNWMLLHFTLFLTHPRIHKELYSPLLMATDWFARACCRSQQNSL